MQLIFMCVMLREEAYPGEQETLLEKAAEVLGEQLDNYNITYNEAMSDARVVWADCDVGLEAGSVEVQSILEALNEELADLVFYYGERCYGIAVEYQNWNGELTDNPEVWGDIQVQLELIPQDQVGEESFQWLYLSVDATELENFAISDWYEIQLFRAASEEQAAFLAEAKNWRYAYLPEYQLCVGCFYELLNEEMQDRLQEAYRIESSSGEEVEEDSMVGAIDYNTEFTRAEIYNVGQALCVGIFGAFSYDGGRSVEERLAVFFDFGIPYTAGRPRVGAAKDYQTICREIASFVKGYGRGKETRDRIHIVLSHWHLDHCILAKCFTTELAHTVWHVPCEGLGPSAQSIRSHIVANGGKVETCVGPFDALRLMGNENLQCGKIDFGYKRGQPPAVIRASKHPHHHGMYMMVELASGSKLFLSGDCTYAGINNRLKARGFTWLQASHHGGNYALSPAARNPGDIPRPARGGGLICSCGPYSEQHHPNQAVLTDHGNAGWTAAYVTHRHGRCTIT